jgi:hypothetical protein
MAIRITPKFLFSEKFPRPVAALETREKRALGAKKGAKWARNIGQ